MLKLRQVRQISDVDEPYPHNDRAIFLTGLYIHLQQTTVKTDVWHGLLQGILRGV